MTVTITELLSRAKDAIASGEIALHAAAEDIAAAQEQGATQRQIAEAVGKSAAWINRLLKWRQSGYQDGSAFGPQAKASRQRAAQRVQATEHTVQATEHTVQATEQKKHQKQKPATTSEQAQACGRVTFWFPEGERELLVKALGMLGSDHVGERESAALVVEKQRAKLGMTWEELIIPADEV